MQVKTGDKASARAMYQETLTIDRRLALLAPDDVVLLRSLQVGLFNIGDYQAENGDAASALSSYLEALALARKLAARDPDNAGIQKEIATILIRLGNLKLNGKDWVGALPYYNQSLDIDRAQALRDPGNAETVFGVAATVGRISFIKRELKDYVGAADTMAEAVDIARKAASAHPDNKKAQIELLIVLDSDALMNIEARRFSEALSLADEGLALAKTKSGLLVERACALMFLGRSDEARDLFQKHRGAWDGVLKSRFAGFRAAGLDDPMMGEIETKFSAPAPAPQVR